MDEKQRRFRTHVVKEIVETERVYTEQVAFVAEILFPKTKEKAGHDKAIFTDDVITKMFCNIEEIHSLHQRLKQSLLQIKLLDYSCCIAQMFLHHAEGFKVYTKYGSNNETAQKQFYELERDAVVKAFFTGCMLLGGHSDTTVDAYLFKPVQRICKYPLLFKELLKYTPPDHPDHAATEQMLVSMKAVCSVVNETKRRVEKLEAIADWQATVEGWEGSNVTDTCNEQVMKGTLIKISAGNTQEREFFLFDNLLVYCKKTGNIHLKQKGQKGSIKAVPKIEFKGRIAVENLEVENIEDGRSDYHSNGITVRNGWKVRNIAKNKWFVLLAKTQPEKKEWLDAIRRLKDKKRRQATGRSSDTHDLMRDKGQIIYNQLKRERDYIKDRKYHLKMHPKAFVGREFVQWLVARGEVSNSEEAVRLGQALLENGILHHVTDDHQFKNEDLLYRFRYDDGTYRHKHQLQDIHIKGLRIYIRLQGLYTAKIKEHKQTIGSNMKHVISGSKLVDWLVEVGDVSNRQEAVLLGQDLFAQGILRHISDERKFKDSSSLYYRFTPDDMLPSKKEAMQAKVDTIQRCRELTVRRVQIPWSKNGYGITLAQGRLSTVVGSVEEGSPAQMEGIVPRQSIAAIGHYFVSRSGISDKQLAQVVQWFAAAKAPLQLSLVQTPQFFTTIKPSGEGSLGLHIKGSKPPVVNKLDPLSPAALKGVMAGCCIISINEQDVTQRTHDEVIKIVKQSVELKRAEGVSFKFGVGSIQNIHHYSFEAAEGAKNLYCVTEEAPFTFNVPAQFLLAQSKYYRYVMDILQPILMECKEKKTKDIIQTYIKKLDNLYLEYTVLYQSLSNYHFRHWPSFRPYGIKVPAGPQLLRPVPVNCHLHKMVVTSDVASSEPISPTHIISPAPSPIDDNLSGSFVLPNGPSLTTEIEGFYPFVTMALPSKEDITLSASGRKVDEIQALSWTEGLVRQRYDEIVAERSIVEDFLEKSIKVAETGSMTSIDEQDVLLINGDEGGSPMTRRRLESVSDTGHVMGLVRDGVKNRVDAFIVACESESVKKAFDNTKEIVNDSYDDVITALKRVALKEMDNIKACGRTLSQKAVVAVEHLAEALRDYSKIVSFRLCLAMALLEDPESLNQQDVAFSQMLTAIVTGFMEQLNLALNQLYNPSIPYHDSCEASEEWLTQIANIGLLVAFEAPMGGSKASDAPYLDLLRKTLKLMQGVHICLEPLHHTEKNQLPTLYVEGNRSLQKVVIKLPKRQMDALPERLVAISAGPGVHLQPVIFTHSLSQSPPEYDIAVMQRSINEKSLQVLKEYYRQMRKYRLNKDRLPDDPEAMQAAVHQISQPLNSLEILVSQLQFSMEHMYDGVGLLSLASEAAIRMGGVRITACDTGVYRSSMSLALEETSLLIRCHGLPVKSFRPVLNTLKEGALPNLEKKNNCLLKMAFPVQPPNLYIAAERADVCDDTMGN